MLKAIAVRFITIFCLLGSVQVWALSNEVQIDIATSQLVEALEANNYLDTIKATKKLRSLDVKDVRLDFFDGQALFNIGEHQLSKAALENYVTQAGRESEFYSDAISLLAKLESLIESQSPNIAPGFSSSSQDRNHSEVRRTSPAKKVELDKDFHCPETFIASVDMKPLSFASPAVGEDVMIFSYTCFYGDNAEYAITLQFPSGDKSLACNSPQINPSIAMNQVGWDIQVNQVGLANEVSAQPKLVQIGPSLQKKAFGFGFEDTPGGGVQVSRVYKGSPADKVGLQRGDKLISINKDKNAVHNQFAMMSAIQKVGKKIKIEYITRDALGKTVVNTKKIKRKSFIWPRPIFISDPNNLAKVFVEAPFYNGDDSFYQSWIALGQSFLPYAKDKALACD